MTQPASDPVARQLIGQAEMISRLRHDLDQLANEITDAYADLLARIESTQPTADSDSASPASWCWRTLGPEATEELTAQLHDWVSWLRSRYPLAKKIAPCWNQHPEIVEELTALWLAWQAAYEQDNASLTGAADWHDRWLPGLLHRLEHGPHAIDCGNRHTPRPHAVYDRGTDK